MFESSRLKIVAAIMGGLLFLLAGTIGLIYGCSYQEVLRTDREMLSRYAEAYWKNGNPAEDAAEEPAPEPGDPQRDRTYRLLTFHSVAFAADGRVQAIDNGADTALADDYLTALAQRLLQQERDSGVLGSWVYYIEQQQGITLVVLMDNTILSGSMGALLRYTLLFGGLAAVLLFFVSLELSRRIVRPLEESHRKQKQFISEAGHELKTPLAVARTNAELLERQVGPNRWLSNMRYELDRMEELVHQLLELAHAEQAKPQRTQVDLSRLTQGSALPFEGAAYEKGQVLALEIAEHVQVWGNAEQLESLVTILLDNALDYAPPHSTVWVRLGVRRGRALLSVTNDGAAIPKEQQERLFERFHRGDAAHGERAGHYGLGLAIAQAVVRSHKGWIEVICRDGQITLCAELPLHRA